MCYVVMLLWKYYPPELIFSLDGKVWMVKPLLWIRLRQKQSVYTNGRGCIKFGRWEIGLNKWEKGDQTQKEGDRQTKWEMEDRDFCPYFLWGYFLWKGQICGTSIQ